MNRFFSVLSFLFLFSPALLQASHIRGGDFNFECVGNSDSVRVTLNLFYACYPGSSAPSNATINIVNSCTTSTSTAVLQLQNPGGTNVSHIGVGYSYQFICNNASPGFPGTVLYTYSTVVPITPVCNGFWKFSFSQCCRFPILKNTLGGNFYLEGEYHGQSGCNNSPAFQTLIQPVPFPTQLTTTQFNYDVSVIETDGDSLHYSLVPARTSPTNNLNYFGGTSGAMPVPGATINPTTGRLSFTTPFSAAVSRYLINVKVEEYDLNGNHLSTIYREFEYTTHLALFFVWCYQCIPPEASLPTNLGPGVAQVGQDRLEVEQGQTLSFDVIMSDTTDSVIVESNVNQVLPGATFTTIGSDTVTASINWVATLPGYHEISIYATDNSPAGGLVSRPVIIRVLDSISAGPDQVSCNGQGAQLQASGATSYTWSTISGDPIVVGQNFSCNPCANPVASPSVTTTYQVSNSSQNNDDQVTVFVSVISANYSATPPACGQSNGSISISASGSHPPFQYSIDGGNTYSNFASFTGLSAGTYSVQVQNNLGCTTDTLITFYSLPSLDSFSLAHPTCQSDSNGDITFQQVNGLTPFQYSIDNGQTFQSNINFSGLTGGSYQLVLQAGNGCQSLAQTVSLNSISDLTLIGVTGNDETCPGDSDGGLNINATTSQINQALQYSIDGGLIFGSGSNFGNLPPGSYPIQVMDVNGCLDSSSFTIGAGVAPTISNVTTQDVSCLGLGDGSVNILASGGSGPVQYSIDGGLSFSSSSNFNNLIPGTYATQVMDGNGCLDSSTFTIAAGTSPVISTISSQDVSCNGAGNGSVNVIASGGSGSLVYSIDGGQNKPTSSFTNLIPGNYSIVVTDTNGCQDTSSVILVEPPQLIATSTGDTTICDGDSTALTATATGGAPPFSYNWTPGNLSGAVVHVSPSSQTDYTTIVTDANGCTSVSTPVSIDLHPDIEVSLPADTIIQSGDSVILCANASLGFAPYGYMWSTGMTTSCITVQPTSTSTFTVIASDQCGNEAIDTIIIQVDSSLSIAEPMGVADFNVYPNPYRGQTTIEYQLTQPNEVSLIVLDPMGKIVAYPIDAEVLPAGRYQTTFSAVKSGLANGLYFVQLRVGNQIFTKKIMEIQ